MRLPLPAAYTLFDRLLALRDRFAALVRARRDPDPRRHRARPGLEPMEPRVLLDGRPLPYPEVFVGAGPGAEPAVRAYEADTGALRFEVLAYGAAFRGGVRVAAGDFNRDGVPDAVVAPGPGRTPVVKIFDGKTGDQLDSPVGRFTAFSAAAGDGVFVAAADVDGDAVPDVIAAANLPAGPTIKVFSGSTGGVLTRFVVPGKAFAAGVTVAAADLTGDGKAEVVVGAAGSPRVRVYDPSTWEVIPGPLGAFDPFGGASAGGVFVGAGEVAGDVDADGTPDLAVGTRSGGARVRVFSGATGGLLRDLLPFGEGVPVGARVALAYVDDDPHADVVAGTGPGAPAAVVVLSGADGTPLAAPVGVYAPFGPFAGGVYVAASNDPPTGAVRGLVWYDADADGTPDAGEAVPAAGVVTVELTDGTSVLATTTADAAGSYSFAGLADGTYTVRFVAPAGYTFSAPEDGYGTADVTAGSTAAADAGLVGYGLLPGGDAGVGGTVWYDWDGGADRDDPEPVVGAGVVTVELSDGTGVLATATTDAAGSYEFAGVWAGEYLLRYVAPDGYTVSAPAGGETWAYLSPGSADDSAGAGLVSELDLDGWAMAAVEGQEYAGVVAAGTGWDAGSLSATVDWGDGTTSAGTVVPGGDGFQVVGAHTYPNQGYYALTVRVTKAGDTGPAAVAAGLGFVLDPDDDRRFEKVGSAAVAGGGAVGNTNVADEDSLGVSADGWFAYSLGVGGDTPGGSFTLDREGSLGFTTGWTVSGEGAGKSDLGLGGWETSTRVEVVAEPDRYGSATETATTSYSLTQEGTGASYGWVREGEETVSRAESGNGFDGPFSAWEGRWASTTAAGSTGPGGAFGASWEGDEWSSRSESTVRWGQTHSRYRDGWGAVTGSAGGSGGSYWWAETGGGDFYLSAGSSDAAGGGGDSVSGAYTRVLTAYGDEASGAGTVTDAVSDPGGTGWYEYAYTGPPPSFGVPASTAGAVTRDDASAAVTTGNQVTGSFTLAASSSTSRSAPELVTGYADVSFTGSAGGSRSSATVVTGVAGAGAYTLTGTASYTSSSSDAAAVGGADVTRWSVGGGGSTASRTGDRLTGTYDHHETASYTSSSGTGGGREETATAGGVTGTASVGSSRSSSSGGSSTAARTGSVATGSYGLHQTSTDGSAGSSGSSAARYSSGGGATQSVNGSDAGSSSRHQTATADRTGNVLTGTYDLHQTSTSTAVASGGSGSGATAGFGAGASSDAGGSSGGSSTTTATSTADTAGDDLSGTYSLHQVSTFTAERGSGSSGGGGYLYADTSEETGDGSGSSTATETGSSTLDRTGNAHAGTYAAAEVGTSTSAATTSASGGWDGQYTSGATGDGGWSAGATVYRTGGWTAARSGNEWTGDYSLATNWASGSTAYGTNTADGSDDPADPSSGGGGAESSATVLASETGAASRGGNSFSGTYSAYDSVTTTSVGTDTATASGDYAWAVGSTYDGTSRAAGTATATATASTAESGNAWDGSYQLYRVTTTASTAYPTATATDTFAWVNTADDGGTAASTTTLVRTSDVTVDRAGNRATGEYTEHQEGAAGSGEYGPVTGDWAARLAAGSKMGEAWTRVVGSGRSGGWTYDRVGNEVTGAYTLTGTRYRGSGGGVTLSAEALYDLVSGVVSDADDAVTTTGGSSEESTLYRTGNSVVGEFTEYETSTLTGSAYDRWGGGATNDFASGAAGTASGSGTYSGGSSGTATSTTTGNDQTGLYSLHLTGTSEGTEYHTASSEGTDHLADGGSGTGSGGGVSTVTVTTTYALDRGWSELTGESSEHRQSSFSRVSDDTSSGGASGTGGDGSSGSTGGGGSATAAGSGTFTLDRTSNWVTGSYSLRQVNTWGDSATATGSGGDSYDHVDGSDGSSGGDGTSTGTRTGSVTLDREGNEYTGTYSQHEVGTTTDSGRVTGTQHATDDFASGSALDGLGTATGTMVVTRQWVSDREGDDYGGTYTLHDVSSVSTTFVSDGTDQGTGSWADGLYDQTGGDGRTTVYQTAGRTVDRSGNANTGAYSAREVATFDGTLYGQWSGTSDGTLSDASDLDGSGSGSGTRFTSGTSTADRTGNVETGAYALTGSGTSAATAYDVGTSKASFARAGVVGRDGDGSGTTTVIESGDATVSENGNTKTGVYYEYRLSHSTSTHVEGWTSGGRADWDEGSDLSGDGSGGSTRVRTGTASYEEDGDRRTGDYSFHRVHDTSNSSSGTATQGEESGLSDGSTRDEDGEATGGFTRTTGYTLDREGNVWGNYSEHEVRTWDGTVYGTATGTEAADFRGEGQDTDGEGTATVVSSGSVVTDRTGSDATGSYSLREVASRDSTVLGEAVSDLVWGGATVAREGRSTDSWSEDTTTDRTGNASTGSYSLHQTGTSDSSSGGSSSQQGLSHDGTTGGSRAWTLDRTGNDATGVYSLTRVETHDATTPVSGVDARGSYSGTETRSGGATVTGVGSAYAGTGTAVTTGTSTVTLAVSGGDGVTGYDRTLASTDAYAVTDAWADGVGDAARTSVNENEYTLTEDGSTPTTGYALVEVGHATVAEAVTSNGYTGGVTVVRSETRDSSLHQTGSEGGGGAYTLDKTVYGYRTTTREGNPEHGGYTLTGTAGETSTAVGTSTNSGLGATFTEVLTEDASVSEGGNDRIGAYVLVESGTTTADFVDRGTTAAGSFFVTEGAEGTFDRTTAGNRNTGAYTLDETSSTGYSATQEVDGSEDYTWAVSGTDAATAAESGNRLTGAYSRSEDGTDGYALAAEGVLSGGSFSQEVTGSDDYAVIEAGNREKNEYDRTTTGGGGWTRTSSGPGAGLGSGSGANAYTVTGSGHQLAGHFDTAVTGSTRYGLVERFADVSNTDSGRTPGNVTFHSHGLPFRDPSAPSPWVNPEGGFTGELTTVRWGPQTPKEEAPTDPTAPQAGSGGGSGGTGAGGTPLTFAAVVDKINAKTRNSPQNGLAPSFNYSPQVAEVFQDGEGNVGGLQKTGELFANWIGYMDLLERSETARTVTRFFRGLWHGTTPEGGERYTRASGGEEFVPVYGNTIDAMHAAERGAYVKAGVNLLLAISDIFLVKTVVQYTGRGAVKATGALSSQAKKLIGGGAAKEAGMGAGVASDVTKVEVAAAEAAVGEADAAATAAARRLDAAVADAVKRSGKHGAATRPAQALEVLGGRVCFTAGTPLLTPDGSKPVEAFRPGDLVLSRPETDPGGWVEPKVVEEVFVRAGRVLWLTVSGRRIGTTAEHPFYVVGKGWRCAGTLECGDLMASHNAAPGVVEAIAEEAALTTVYNLRVADFHTYFVGCDEWGFSVWAHNTCYQVIEVAPGRYQAIDLANRGQVVERLPGVAQEWTSRQAVETWAKGAGHTLREGTVTASKTMSEALNRAKDAAGIPRSMQSTKQWTIRPQETRRGPGVVHEDPGHQGRIFEYEIVGPGGQTQYRYIVVHDVDPTHGGIGHVHVAQSPQGPTFRLPRERNYENLDNMLPGQNPIPFLEK